MRVGSGAGGLSNERWIGSGGSSGICTRDASLTSGRGDFSGRHRKLPEVTQAFLPEFQVAARRRGGGNVSQEWPTYGCDEGLRPGGDFASVTVVGEIQRP